ncbi:pseudouridine synthase [Flavobacteriales bacterium]|nr:pseudouridine synthase [Flavobacteriales bacterium]
MDDSQPRGIRINKYLSEVGHCSRRAADKLLEEGRITLNGAVPELGTRVQPGDEVAVDGEVVAGNDQERIVIAYNKPVGIVCTTDQRREKDNIIDAINFPTRIYPVGRLDKMSEGLIFLTNDGDIVNDILRARYGHEKEYHVTVNQPITDDFLKKMSAGVAILDTVTLPCEVEQTGRQSFKIVLKQGLNRQIRRMCEALGYRVRRLKRTRIIHVELGDLPEGQYRSLDDQELNRLRQSTQGAKEE